MQGGIGRTILAYGIASGGDPAKPWCAIFGAVAVGLVVAGLVSLIGLGLGRFRRAEESA
jgi:NitT/TauT family transport system permease protein